MKGYKGSEVENAVHISKGFWIPILTNNDLPYSHRQ